MTGENPQPLFELRYFDIKNKFDIIFEFAFMPTMLAYNIWNIYQNDNFKFAFWNCLILLVFFYFKNINRNIKSPLLIIRNEFIAYRKYASQITTVIPRSHVVSLVVEYGFLKIHTIEGGKPHSIAIPKNLIDQCKITIANYLNQSVA